MKQLLLFCLLLLAVPGMAQEFTLKGLKNFPLNTETGRVSYEGVVELSGTSADELYTRSKEWFIRTFNDGNQVLHLDDRQTGKLIGKAVLTGQSTGFTCGGNYSFPFVLTVEVKDGKYRYSLTEIDYKSWVDSQKRYIEGTLEKHTEFTGCEKSYNAMYAKLHKDFQALVHSLNNSINTAQKKEDW